MKYRFLCATAALTTLAACGGGGGTTATTAPPVVSAPAPTPSPAPSPTPTPSSATYQTFANLTGNQTFRTACASYLLVGPPVANPATAFGNGLSLSYTAATDSYAISGDGLSLSYGPTDVDAAVLPPAKGYLKVDSGFTQRFIIGRPSPGGATLDYLRTIFLVSQRSTERTHYQCVFGVPTLTTDAPSGSVVTFAKVGLSAASSSYRFDTTTSPNITTYSLENSTATLSANLTTGAVTSVIHLLGTVRTSAGAGETNVELGTYTGTGTIDTTIGSYSGQFADAAGNRLDAYFGGWFFGPQGREAGFAFNIVKRDTTGGQISAVGTVTAQQ